MRSSLLVAFLCLIASPAWAFQVNAGISGSWFNVNKPGHGFAVEFADAGACTEIDDQGCLVVYWFTYTPGGDPIFLLGTGPVDGNQADIDLTYYSGQAFGSFTPVPEPHPWGSLHLRFSDCGSGFANFDSQFSSDGGAAYGSGMFPITRLSSVGSLGCGSAARLADIPDNPLGGVWFGSVVSRDFPSSNNGQLQSANAFALVRDDGEMTLFTQNQVLMTLRGTLHGDGVDQSGVFRATAAFPTKLIDGSVSGNATVDVGGNATLSNLSSTPTPGKVNPGDYVEGHMEAPGLSADFRLHYQTATERPSDMARVEGCWGSWTANAGQSAAGNVAVGADGHFSYELNGGCKVDGTISPGSEAWGAYDAQATVSHCDFNGEYTGNAFVIDSSGVGADNYLSVELDDGTNSLFSAGFKVTDDQCD